MASIDMALLTASNHSAPLIESEVALKIMLRDGDPTIPDHRTAFWALHRRVGRMYGHKAAPACWEVTL